jgi:putative heme transporter
MLNDRKPLTDNRVVRAGVVAWAVLGLVGVLVVLGAVVAELRLVVVPLLIALFPAALLAPLSEWMKRRGVRPALASLVVLVGFLVGLVTVLGVLGWLIAEELEQIFDTLQEAYDDIRAWISDTFDVEVPDLDRALEQAQEWATGDNGVGGTAGSAAVATLEAAAAVLFGVVALFFYLKDGARIAAWLRDLFPRSARDDAAEIGRRIWFTLGAYFRGQLMVAAVDAFFIGLGLFLLGVPLALPLAVLVFFGGLFPIVGAFTAGAIAVLVALADRGIAIAIAVLVLNVVVQQVEGNVLEPVIVGRATQLNPLAVLLALTAGAATLGILGAFLAVPVAASLTRAVGYLRTDVDDPVAEEMDARS